MNRKEILTKLWNIEPYKNTIIDSDFIYDVVYEAMKQYANEKINDIPIHIKKGITNTKVTIIDNTIIIEPAIS